MPVQAGLSKSLPPSSYVRSPRLSSPDFRVAVAVHGMEDDSQAIKPIQSHRLFHALRGHCTRAKLVLLPYENHRYFARESILHAAAEMIEWFEIHLKKKP